MNAVDRRCLGFGGDRSRPLGRCTSLEDGDKAGKHVVRDRIGDGCDPPSFGHGNQARGSSQRIPPVDLVPVPSVETTNPRLCAKLPPW